MLAKLLIATALCTLVPVSFAATDKVVCYLASWAVYRTDNGKFEIENIDASTCTHIYYAFLGINPDGSIYSIDAWADIDLGGFQKVNDLKNRNPNLKTVISVGGANAGPALLTGIAADPQKRQTLISSAMSYFTQYGFNGLDLDWEYPGAADRDNFITLLQEIKSAFSAGGYHLGVAVSAIPIDDAYDVVGMSNNVDLINLMTYDFHVAAAGVTGQNSPLYAGSADNDWQKEYENINSTVVQWTNRGADPQKLTIGLGFYGHSFTLSNPGDHGVGSPCMASGNAGPYTKNAGTLGYNEICELFGNWERVWDDQQKNPYKFSGDQWTGYDDPDSIALKVQYARDHNLAGVMIWTVDTDDFRGVCGPANPLMQAIKNNL